MLRQVWDRLQPLARETSPFDAARPTGRGHHWVEPRLVCEVRFTEWTDDGGLRHPAFLGLRADKKPEDCGARTGVAADGDGAPADASRRPAADDRPDEVRCPRGPRARLAAAPRRRTEAVVDESSSPT